MERRNKTKRGELLPDVTLPSGGRQNVRLSDYRGRLNLVVILAGGMDDENVTQLLASAARKHSDLLSEEAAVIAIVSKNRAGRTPSVLRADWPLVVLIDRDGHAHQAFNALDADGTAVPAVFIADRYGEIYAEYHADGQHELPGIDEVLEWLSFINIQCPECGAPEWPG